MDARVSLDPIVAAFAVAATVTRPAPNDTPVATFGVWIRGTQRGTSTDPTLLDGAYGNDLPRRDPRRLFSVIRAAALPTIEVGSQILAPEQLGDVPKTWMVDQLDRFEVDEMRVIVKLARGV